MIDVERLQADLRDHFIEQCVADVVLQLRANLAAEGLASFDRVQLQIEIRHPLARQVVDVEVRTLAAIDRGDCLRHVGDRRFVVLDRQQSKGKCIQFFLAVRERVLVGDDRIDEELLKQTAAQLLEDLHVAEERAHLFLRQLDVVHEGELVDERRRVIDAIE